MINVSIAEIALLSELLGIDQRKLYKAIDLIAQLEKSYKDELESEGA